MKKFLFQSCFLFVTIIVHSQSKAHKLSEVVIVDPAYSSEFEKPKSLELFDETPWIYGTGELESWRLELLQRRKDSAKLRVGYPGVFHKPYNKITFQFDSEEPLRTDEIILRRVGYGKVYINNRFVKNLVRNKNEDTIITKDYQPIKNIRIALTSVNDPPALLINGGPFKTSSEGWQWRTDSEKWTNVTQFPQNRDDLPPHLLEEQSFEVIPVSEEEGLIDFGLEIYGYIRIKSKNLPVLYFGESAIEAKDTINTILEQTRELIKESDGVWRSKVPLAFRYIFSNEIGKDQVICEALIRPGRYKGAFASSDTLLNKIWMYSAYTLRLNMHDFLLDGMKRDRLPWTGDMAMSLLVNSFTFYDSEIARRSLVALGRAGIEQSDINGIVDYSLWWIISQDLFQLYYKDSIHLNREWDRIKRVLEILDSRTDSNGFLKIGAQDWVFIDWVEQPKWTAVQVLWWWAQQCASNLASRMGDDKLSAYWNKSSENLRKSLYKNVWDSDVYAWLASPNPNEGFTRHANFLAIVSGLTSIENGNGILKLLQNKDVPAVGTPYMAGFEMMARSKLGNIDYSLEKISNYWGGMIALGATSFWEAYDPDLKGSNQYAFYGRPYGKSLNHAWSSGPAAILPSEIIGAHPLEDGWKRFSVSPKLGSLKWVSVSIPTNYGPINIDTENKNISVSIPSGTTMELYGNEYIGPQIISKKIK